MVHSHQQALIILDCRLKISLNLPPIEPRPPVPPRIYQRIYKYLDKILPATSLAGRPKGTGSGTPRSKGLSSPASRPLPSRGTPTKNVSLSQFRTPGKGGTPSRLNTQSAVDQADSALPLWIRPTVRFMCTSLAEEDSPSLVPTIIAGLESIIIPYHRRTKDEWVNLHLTSLVGAIYWFVSESARLAPGEEMTPESSQARYKSVRKEVLAVFRRAQNGVEVLSRSTSKKAQVTEEDRSIFWDGWQDGTKAANLDEAVTEVTNRGWLNSDWYRSIEFLRDRNAGLQDDADESLGENPAATAAAVQITKADTMLQDKFDYLSERRRADYQRWKRGILQQIKVLQRSEGAETMEVDP